MSAIAAARRPPFIAPPLVPKAPVAPRNVPRNTASANEHGVEEGLKKGMNVMNNRMPTGVAAGIEGTLSWGERHPFLKEAGKILATEALIQGAIMVAPWAVGLVCPPLGAAIGCLTGGAALYRGIHGAGMLAGAGMRGGARWMASRGAREVVAEGAHLGGAAASKAMAAGSRSIFQRGGSAISIGAQKTAGKVRTFWHGEEAAVNKSIARHARHVEKVEAAVARKAERSALAAGEKAAVQGVEQAAGKSVVKESARNVGTSWGTQALMLGGQALEGMGSALKGVMAGFGAAVGMATDAVGTGLNNSGMDGRPIMTMDGAEGGGGSKGGAAGGSHGMPPDQAPPQNVPPMYGPAVGPGGGATNGGGKAAPSKGANVARENLNRSFKGGAPKVTPRAPMVQHR